MMTQASGGKSKLACTSSLFKVPSSEAGSKLSQALHTGSFSTALSLLVTKPVSLGMSIRAQTADLDCKEGIPMAIM